MPGNRIRSIPEELEEGIFILAGKLYKKYGKHVLTKVTVDRSWANGVGVLGGVVIATAVGNVKITTEEAAAVRSSQPRRYSVARTPEGLRWADQNGQPYTGECYCGDRSLAQGPNPECENRVSAIPPSDYL